MRILILCFFSVVIAFGQQSQIVDFKELKADITLFPKEKKVSGTLHYTFKTLQKTDSVFLDAKQMKVQSSEYSQTKVSYKATDDKIWLKHSFEANKEYAISFYYEAFPKQAMYFFEDQVWTQGQGKYTSHWLPSIDDVNDKIIFNLSITAPAEFVVLANGRLEKQSPIINDQKQWKYTMNNPMSSYLVAIAMGNFENQSETSSSGIPLQYHYTPENESKVEPTYRYTKRMFDFLEEEIGVGYPWENYKQVPVRDFLYAGMENTTLTIFSEAFVVDSIGFVDRNYVNVNAHELAHQWFGNLVTAESSEHHWLQEGFSTYYALLAEREIFGEDYYYWKLYQSAEQLTELSEQGKGEPIVKAGASSLTYYQKGAWALHILNERAGNLVFKQAVGNFLNKYKFGSATTDDFLNEITLLNGDDLQWFKDDWLYQGAFRSSQALESLRKSPFIENYLGLSAIANRPFSEKKEILSGFLNTPVNDYLGQAVVYQLADVPFGESQTLYKKAFESGNLFVRQAIAMSLEQIPPQLKTEYESLLDDASYMTREAALYFLWLNFPEERKKYLDKMNGVIGFQDKNIRQLWLTLAMVTEDYKNEEKPGYFNELSSYASTNYSFEIRQQAFQFLVGLDGFTNQNLKYLIDACMHHNWRFKNSSREILDELLKNEETKLQIVQLKNELPEIQRLWLDKY
ncbi:MAG: M1 family metallopeptidase [Flavobacteriaceae bacterium]